MILSIAIVVNDSQEQETSIEEIVYHTFGVNEVSEQLGIDRSDLALKYRATINSLLFSDLNTLKVAKSYIDNMIYYVRYSRNDSESIISKAIIDLNKILLSTPELKKVIDLQSRVLYAQPEIQSKYTSAYYPKHIK